MMLTPKKNYRSGNAPGCAVAVLLALAVQTLPARPFTPPRTNQVLERVEAKPGAEAQQLRRSETALRNDPANVALAAEVARGYLEKYRADGDPRALSYAETALRSWWTMPDPPGEILLLRATIHQGSHRFAASLVDLAGLLKQDPRNTQAWLLRATVLQVLGRYAEARQAAWSLARLDPGLPAVACAAAIGSLVGQAEQSFLTLQRALASSTNAPVPERLWALTILAEIAARRGDFEQAEQRFKEGLALGKRDTYLLGAYADFLIDQGRPQDAIRLLREETTTDRLLLSLAIAEKKAGLPEVQLAPHVAALRERFAASRLRGETLHQREEARFLVHLCGEPAKALPLVRANWETQKEPADLRIMLEAAIACRDGGAAGRAAAWVNENKLEDVAIEGLLRQWKDRSASP